MIYHFHITQKLIKNLNFKIHKNQIINIRGMSGSGKSTLISLLLGFLDGFDGNIFINEIKISEIDLYDFRKKIGYVGPEPYLINDTIINNIQYGLNKNLDNEELDLVLSLSQCKSFINNDHDLKNIISEQGSGLSMGQKQRLCLARALAKNPEVLVLDEITANLDSTNEDLIIDQLKNLKQNKIIIIASHSNKFSNIADIEIDLN